MGSNKLAIISMFHMEKPDRYEALAKLQERGMTTLYLNHKDIHMLSVVPDSLGKNEELDDLPPFVRNYKCNDKIEDLTDNCIVSMRVNRLPVTSLSNFAFAEEETDCYFLRNVDGFTFRPNSEGRFSLRA
jgi:hypothetical protein